MPDYEFDPARVRHVVMPSHVFAGDAIFAAMLQAIRIFMPAALARWRADISLIRISTIRTTAKFQVGAQSRVVVTYSGDMYPWGPEKRMRVRGGGAGMGGSVGG